MNNRAIDPSHFPTHFAPLRQPTISEKILPYLHECDRAVADAVELREQLADMSVELRHSRAMQDSAADRVDLLTAELAISNKECSLLRARMKMFGEAAAAICEEASKEARDSYVPQYQEPFVPSQQGQTRPVRLVKEEIETDEIPFAGAGIRTKENISTADMLAQLHTFTR